MQVVFRYALTGPAISLVDEVVRAIGRYVPGWTVTRDPELKAVAWKRPYPGFCQCGFDKAMREWLLENAHSESCGYPDGPCVCGQWAELDRWKEGLGHRADCGKAVRTLVIADVGLFYESGRWDSDREMCRSDWERWKNVSIREIARG